MSICLYIDIPFSFTISRDIKSSVRNSDLKILKKGHKTGYQSWDEERQATTCNISSFNGHALKTTVPMVPVRLKGFNNLMW